MVLHGHFYQPPRENPWTGIVPLQKSATPFHDWNCRITKECYAANSFSRYLDSQGRIEDIVNNYEYISFNFGPTLMGWLKEHAPNVYMRILEADRISMKKNGGHGNAIAQGYNHTILPLDTPPDAELQIVWGLEDFKSHFKRESEGIWLPEAAVNYEIIDLLIEKGIKFIILSPWQAEAIQTDDSEEWQLLDDQPVPSWRSYRIEREKGSITVFFYNNLLAQGISFGHYLRNANTLYTRLKRLHSSRESSHLIHTATDGEIYGHHEPFGDMCLAALVRKINNDSKFSLTNYGYYLERHPPVYKVRLKQGEDKKGTSWSCFHGVSRWYKDCGCHTGGTEGWNQKWRTPLRWAYEALSEKLVSIYKKEIRKISDEHPEIILKEYIDILTGKESMEIFAGRFLKDRKHSKKDKIRLFKLLEGQKFRMYTFTSCGWFFSELSGIEPVQNMKYALKAIEIYSQFTHIDLTEDFLIELQKANSNISTKGTGKDIFLSLKPEYPVGLEAAIDFLIQNISSQNKTTSTYGNFTLLSAENTVLKEGIHTESKIDLTDRTTGKEYSYLFTIPDESSENFSITVSTYDSRSSEKFMENLETLPEDLRRKIVDVFIIHTEEMCSMVSSENFPKIKRAFRYAKTLKIPISGTIVKTAEISVTTQLKQILSDPQKYISETDLKTMEDLLRFVEIFNISIDKDEISHRLSRYLAVQFDKPQPLINDFSIQYIFRLYENARIGGIEPEVTIPQNLVFHHVEEWRKSLDDPRYTPDKKSHQILNQLIAMSDILSINVDDLKDKINLFSLPE